MPFPGIDGELGAELVRGQIAVFGVVHLLEAGKVYAAEPVMNTRAGRFDLQHLVICENRSLEVLLAFVGLALCPEHPGGIRRFVMQFFRHEVGEVSIDATCVIENFGVVGVDLVKRQRGLDGVGVAMERSVGAEEFEATLALDLRFGGGVKARFEAGEGFSGAAGFLEADG